MIFLGKVRTSVLLPKGLPRSYSCVGYDKVYYTWRTCGSPCSTHRACFTAQLFHRMSIDREARVASFKMTFHLLRVPGPSTRSTHFTKDTLQVCMPQARECAGRVGMAVWRRLRRRDEQLSTIVEVADLFEAIERDTSPRRRMGIQGLPAWLCGARLQRCLSHRRRSVEVCNIANGQREHPGTFGMTGGW